MSLRMAKASRGDLDAAFALDRAFQCLLSYGYEPTETDDDESDQRFDIDDPASCRRVLDRLMAIARRGSLMRVAMGLEVLIDPRNEIVDPALDYLAPHPKAVAAVDDSAQLTRVADALYAALSRFPADPSPIDVAADPDGATTTEWTLAALDLQTVAIEQSRGLAEHRTTAGMAPRITPDEVAGTPATSDDRGGPDDGAPPAPPAVDAGGGGVSALDLVAHLRRQRDFSLRTFGPGARSSGVVDHIRKELLEIEAAPSDLAEWVDVVILAFDGAWRIGATPEQIVAALLAKQAKNEARTWPDWRTADPSKAIEHDRSRDGGAG